MGRGRSGGHGGPRLGPRTDTVWILWLRDPTQTAKTDNNSGRQRRKFLPGWTARGEGRLAGTPRRRLGQSARGRRRFQGAPRRAPPPPPARSARALELLRRFPARARVTLRGLLPRPTPPALPAPLPEPTTRARLSVPLHELLALEGGGGEKKKIPASHPFLWGWFLHKPVFYFKACLKKRERESARERRERMSTPDSASLGGPGPCLPDLRSCYVISWVIDVEGLAPASEKQEVKGKAAMWSPPSPSN